MEKLTEQLRYEPPPPPQGLIKSLKRQEKGISSQPISWSLQTAMRPWAGLPWQQWDSGEKALGLCQRGDIAEGRVREE